MNYSFLYYYFGVFTKPYKTFLTLGADRRRLRFAFYALCLQIVVYTLVYIFLVMGDGRPFKPWLCISPENYYWYNRFFLAPTMLLAWILAAGVVQLVSKAAGGMGSFEDTVCVIGFGIAVASWATGLHDLLTSFLGACHIISQQGYELLLNTATVWRTLLWILMSLYLVWFCILFAKGIRAVHQLPWGKAIPIAVCGFIIYQGFFFIFSR